MKKQSKWSFDEKNKKAKDDFPSVISIPAIDDPSKNHMSVARIYLTQTIYELNGLTKAGSALPCSFSMGEDKPQKQISASAPYRLHAEFKNDAEKIIQYFMHHLDAVRQVYPTSSRQFSQVDFLRTRGIFYHLMLEKISLSKKRPASHALYSAAFEEQIRQILEILEKVKVEDPQIAKERITQLEKELLEPGDFQLAQIR